MAERKNRHIGWWPSVVLLVALGVLFFGAAFSALNELPSVSEYRRSRLSEGIPFSLYEKLPNESYSEHLAASAELNTENVDGIGEVMPVLVNENFFDVYNIFAGGSAITKEHVTEKLPAVVISDEAAFRMSLDADVIGRSLTLWGKKFTVVGIYRKPDGFLKEMSSDMYERVYLPYTCYDGWEEVPVDTFAAPKNTYSRKALPLLGMTGTDTGFYIENDLITKHDMIENIPRLFLSLIALILAIVVIRILIGMSRDAARRLREAGQKEYPRAVLRQNGRYLISRVLIALALAAVPIALFILFPPKLILPASYIPYDNVFEISHYVDTFINRTQLTNARLALGNGYYQQLFSNALLMLAGLFVLLIILLVIIGSRLIQYIRKRAKTD
ncbi:MAG: ABC transporter permease [Ruminococcus sp.]|nr:ABC transporter permease [Ruminococcus sp.]